MPYSAGVVGFLIEMRCRNGWHSCCVYLWLIKNNVFIGTSVQCACVYIENLLFLLLLVLLLVLLVYL